MITSRIKTIRHGMYGTRPYSIWSGIKRRCYNTNDISYKKYGAKGIVMCDEWRSAFLDFWDDMKDTYFGDAQIDRIDNSKGYSKRNCRWVTLKEQANNKSSVVLYEHNSKKMNASDWEKELGLKTGTIRARIKNGWDIEKALSTSKKKYLGFSKDSRGLYKVEVKRNRKKYFVGRFKTQQEAQKNRKDFILNLLEQ